MLRDRAGKPPKPSRQPRRLPRLASSPFRYHVVCASRSYHSPEVVGSPMIEHDRADFGFWISGGLAAGESKIPNPKSTYLPAANPFLLAELQHSELFRRVKRAGEHRAPRQGGVVGSIAAVEIQQ